MKEICKSTKECCKPFMDEVKEIPKNFKKVISGK